MVVMIAIGAGVVVAAFVSLLARKWPVIEAPRVSAETIVKEATEHRRLADHLHHHFDPTKETGVALIAATAIVAAAAVGIGILLALIRSKFGLRSVDFRLARYGAIHATDWSTETLRWISQLGGTTGIIVIAASVCIIDYVRRPNRTLPVFLTLVVAGQFALSNGIKVLVERARPDISRLTGYSGTSFPSGHATAAAATFAAAALVITRGRSDRTKILAASTAAGIAALVSASRVFLGVHWFSDVIAGMLLGWGWFALCSIAFGGRLLDFGLPLEAAEKAAERVDARTRSVGPPPVDTVR
ncbi:MAG: phosphatase PAP2 family protein [Ilumatobacteraceae bacterium]